MPKRKAKSATKQSNSSRTRCDLATNGAPQENVFIHQEVMDEKVRVRWTNEAIKCFLETCIEEVNKVGRNGGSLRKESWAKLATKLDEVCRLKLTQKQLKNQFDYLKGKYSGWVYLRNRTENIYVPETNMFKLSNQEWEDFFKTHPKAKTLRASPLLFPELCIALFEGTFATDSHVYAPSPIRVVSASSSFTPHIHTTQNEEDEDDDEEGHTYGKRSQEPNVDKSSANPSNDDGPSAPSSRSKKKIKTKVDLDELALEIKAALDILVSQETSNLKGCLDRLNTLGLDPRDPLYCAAIDIFGHSTLLRETWSMIPPDPDILTQWISRTARRLGFMDPTLPPSDPGNRKERQEKSPPPHSHG